VSTQTTSPDDHYRVVVNNEEQYSIWPANRPNPCGWVATGMTGSKDACLAHINEIWKDMRPLSVRRQLQQAAACKEAESCR